METADTSAKPDKKLALIVDDDESFRDLVAFAVSREGLRTVVAEDGVEGLRLARAMTPDLIILDIGLPGLSGYEVLRELAASGHRNIPVIMMTGRSLDGDTLAVMKLETGIFDLLPKPFGTDLLLKDVREALAQAAPPSAS